MHRLLALTAAATALAAGVAAAPSASADTQNSSDPRGDTEVLSAGRLQAAPIAPAVDITGVRTVYQGQKVKVVLTLANLGAAGPGAFVEYIARSKSGESDYVFGVLKQGGMTQAIIQPTNGTRSGMPTWAEARRGQGDCTPGFDIDKKADTVTLVATRECLGAGASVRTGAIAAASAGEGSNFRADDGRRNGQVSPSAADIKLGPAVDRN